MSCERVVPTERLLDEGSFHTLRVNRSMVDGVVESLLVEPGTKVPESDVRRVATLSGCVGYLASRLGPAG